MSTRIEKSLFGQMPDGENVYLFRMTNESGGVAEITTFGATLVGVVIPDKQGTPVRVVRGFPTLDGYLADMQIGTYLGACCGRYANRIAKGKFSLHGKAYTLGTNNGPNHLHGGFSGFNVKNWRYKLQDESVVLTYHAADGEEGYPGNMEVSVTYGWSETNELSIRYEAVCDQDTPVNLTSHAYFNLAGQGSVLNQQLKIHADRYIPIHPDAIPTGEIRHVKGTPFDFTTFKPIGRDLDCPDEQLANGNGYDHCFVLNKKEFGDLSLAAEAVCKATGCRLNVWTTLPGVQFYSANYLRSDLPACDGTPLAFREAFCLEPEFFPDSPNQSGFPCCILKKGETFDQIILFQFSTDAR